MSAPAIRTEGLTRRFGGLTAVNGVSLEVRTGETHALIGPNGAGKTTLVNLLAGELMPSAGTFFLEGRDVTGWTPDRLSRAGLGRSFQHSSIFEDMTLLENVRLAAQSRLPSSMRLWRPASARADLTALAREQLQALGLAAQEGMLAGSMSHGVQRQLEIAMLLATGPRVLLLDEPTAGMGRGESRELARLVQGLKGRHTIVLVEHDMDVVFDVADRVTVLVAGAVLATGTPDEINRDPRARAAYLGERRDRQRALT